MASDCVSKDFAVEMIESALTESYANYRIHLFTNDISPSSSTVVDDFVEPTGDWYADSTLAYGQVHETSTGDLAVRFVSHQFNYSGSDEPETVYGYYITTGDNLVVVCSRRLDTAVTMADDLDSLIVLPGFVLPMIEQS